jgi:hypothetical protein
MSNGAKYTVGIGLGVVAEMFVFLFAIMLSFSGHGHASLPGWFSFVCPLTFIPSEDPEGLIAGIIGTISGITSLLQMPIYGWILARGWIRHTFLRNALVLAFVHFILAIVGLFLRARA